MNFLPEVEERRAELLEEALWWFLLQEQDQEEEAWALWRILRGARILWVWRALRRGLWDSPQVPAGGFHWAWRACLRKARQVRGGLE